MESVSVSGEVGGAGGVEEGYHSIVCIFYDGIG